MKKMIPIFIFLLPFFFFSPSVSAQEMPVRTKEFLHEAGWYGEKRAFWDWPKPYQGRVLAGEVPEADIISQPKGLLPDSPFYFLKKWGEGLRLALTFEPFKKGEMRLKIAEERLAESKQLLEKGKPALAQKLLNEYVGQVSQVAKTLKTVSKEEKQKVLARRLELIAAKHNLVLERVLNQVPESAKPAIKKALEASQKGMDMAADALEKPPVPLDLKTRLESLKKQALVSSEEAAAIINSTSREEVRKKVENLLKEGKFPKADFKFLDAAQKNFLPVEFEKIREEKKVEELKKLKSKKFSQETKEKVENFLKGYKPGNSIPPEIAPNLPFQRIEELEQTIRPELVVSEEIKKINSIGPGGCYNEKSCRAYCSQKNHRDECLKFLEETSRKVGRKVQLLEKGGFSAQESGPGGCRTKSECEQFCQDPAHKSECEGFSPPPPPGGTTKPSEGPGNCQSEEECRAYCQDPAHREECLPLLKKVSVQEGPKFKLPKKERPKEPLVCTSEEECRRYCQKNPQDSACGGWSSNNKKTFNKDSFNKDLLEKTPLKKVRFKKMDEEEMPMKNDMQMGNGMEMEKVKGWFAAGNKGPGNCSGLFSCFLYCSKQSNWQECKNL